MNILFFDMETSYGANLPWMEGAHAVTLHAKDKYGEHTWLINHSSQPKPWSLFHTAWVQEVFDKADRIVAHNLKFDLHWLRAMGIDVSTKQLWCTYVAEYTLTGQQKDGKGLADLCIKYELPQKLDVMKAYWDEGVETYDIPLETILEYGKQDVLSLEALYYAQLPIIEKQNQTNLVKLRSQSLRVTEDIEWNGMHIDKALTESMSTDYGASIDRIYEHLHNLITTELEIPEDVTYNISSGEHLSAILFGGTIKYDGREDTVRILKDGTTKHGSRKAKLEYNCRGFGFIPDKGTDLAKEGFYKTDIAQFNHLQASKQLSEEQKELLYGVSELAKLEKMKGTYFDALLKHEIGGVVHPTINECRTSTGRFSSKNPNSQNFPREGTSSVKQCFITRFSNPTTESGVNTKEVVSTV